VHPLDVTWFGYFIEAVFLYNCLLFGLSMRRAPRDDAAAPSGDEGAFIVLVVPAHNEELVIAHTLESLMRLDYASYLVLVMNDGSADRTSEIARSFEQTGRVAVIDRAPEIAGRGKGAVLNHAYALLGEMAERGDPLLRGRSADSIVVGIVDADGQLERAALARVAPLFLDPQVGAVQTAVRIANAGDGVIPRLQDIEFIGFTMFAQTARDRLGSVALGGNGQFNRLSALQMLGELPWSDCLTEDLDLGLRLAKLGWGIRFCRNTFVAQQGLRNLRALIRQRTRWVQGNYQCMTQIPDLLRARGPLHARLDRCIHLLMAGLVLVFLATTTVFIGAMLGLLTISNESLAIFPAGPIRNLAFLLVATGPVLWCVVSYQRNAARPLKWWEIPAYAAFFGFYGYLCALYSLRAWGRMLGGRSGWAKTPRVQAETAV
jgi:1,2-diacylglycerol 3-beta-glucosyltransferase